MTRIFKEFLNQPTPSLGHKHCFKDGCITNVRPVRDNEISWETMSVSMNVALEAIDNYLTGTRGETSGKGTLTEEVELQEGERKTEGEKDRRDSVPWTYHFLGGNMEGR